MDRWAPGHGGQGQQGMASDHGAMQHGYSQGGRHGNVPYQRPTMDPHTHQQRVAEWWPAGHGTNPLYQGQQGSHQGGHWGGLEGAPPTATSPRPSGQRGPHAMQRFFGRGSGA